MDFFLAGVADTANQAFEAATQIVDLFKEDREKITMESDRAGSVLRIHELFQKNPFHTANQIVQITGLSAPRLTPRSQIWSDWASLMRSLAASVPVCLVIDGILQS